MIVIATDGVVPAPVEEVWDVVRRPEALPAWLAGLRQVAASGPAGVGQRLRLVGSRTGDGLDRQAEIIAWRAPTLLAWRCVSQRRADGDWRACRPDELHMQLTPRGERTRVDLFAVCPAAGLAALGWRMRTAGRWRDELARSTRALADLFVVPAATR